MDLKAGIWASKLVFDLSGWYLGLEFETGGGRVNEEKKEKIPHMCENTGH